MRTFKLVALAVLGFVPVAQLQAAKPIEVDIYQGEVATVNSYIFSNGESLIVMDVQRATSEAKKLAQVIGAKNLPLEYILVSHGHPDHYIGMNWLMKEFPEAKIVVATEDIKKDIISFSTYMEGIGWLDAEPALKPKSKTNPSGFDYEANINVLDDDTLELKGGGTLKIETAYAPAESDHPTTVYVEDINSLFTSDFGYHNVHLWFGSGVTDAHIANWRKALVDLQIKYANLSPTVYPGHGDPNNVDVGLFATMVKYIDNFNRVIASASSRAQAMSEMEKLYPDYKEADFLLKNSVDFHMKE